MNAVLSLNPATTVETATPALDFNRPLEGGDVRFEDLSAARGKDATKLLRRHLERKAPGRFLHAVFASHRGAGKTTELNRLAVDLKSKYRCLYLEANVKMDAFTLAMEDLLLVIAQEVERFMREDVKCPLPSDTLQPVFDWFAEVIETTATGQKFVAEARAVAEAGGDLFFAKLMGRLTAMFRYESEHRTATKRVLRKFPGALSTAVNQLLDGAHRALRDTYGQELLIIIDNLDRYDPKVMDALLIREGDRLAALHCNLVLTPPISLHYRPQSGNLDDRFKVVVMPAVRLREPTEAYDALTTTGSALLCKALGRRIDVARLIPDKAALDRLVVASGGSIRELLEVAQLASLYAESEHIVIDDVERAAADRRAKMRDQINANGWADVLAYIGREKQLRPSENDECLRVLFHRLAFTYNGTHWYDLHPEVANLPEVLAARERLDAAGP